MYGKKEFLKESSAEWLIIHKDNLYFAVIFGKEELDHRGNSVVLHQQFCADNVTVSTILYLLKIQKLLAQILFRRSSKSICII